MKKNQNAIIIELITITANNTEFLEHLRLNTFATVKMNTLTLILVFTAVFFLAHNAVLQRVPHVFQDGAANACFRKLYT